MQTLYQLVNKFVNVKLLQKHSFKVSWVASNQKLLKEKKLLVNTLQPLVREKYWSTKMAFKKSVRKALFAALEGEEDYIEAPNLLSKINLYFT